MKMIVCQMFNRNITKTLKLNNCAMKLVVTNSINYKYICKELNIVTNSEFQVPGFVCYTNFKMYYKILLEVIKTNLKVFIQTRS